MKPNFPYQDACLLGEAASFSPAHDLPAHLLKIPGEQWSFWHWVCLRGSGFPAHLIQNLATSESAAAADRLLSIEMVLDRGLSSAIDGFRLALERTNDETQRKLLRRGLKQLNKGKVPEPTGTPADAGAENFAALLSQLNEGRTRFEERFQRDILTLSAEICEVARHSRFRQAILLQNRAALRRVVHSFSTDAQSQSKRGFKQRQNEEFIANYLQRYCLKNDTIGFFGPVGWAKLVPEPNRLEVEAGSSLISKSSIYFENWCIESLAEKMAAVKSLRPWMAPRLLPFSRVEGTMLYSGGGAPSTIPALHTLVLERCNGECTAREIAHSVIGIPGSGIRTEGQIYAILQAYASRGVISWTIEIPYCLHPEKRLRDFVERIEKEELRRPLLNELDELDRARENVTYAIGNPEQLDHAIEELDTTFTRLTGRSSTKSAGAMYAARTLIYQDCQRDVKVEMGERVATAIGTPLSLLLNSARWFSYRSAVKYREVLRQIYEEFTQKKDRQAAVELLSFWARIEPLIFDPDRRLFNQVIREFQQRWEGILRIPPDARRLQYCSAELRPTVENTFAASAAGWQLARYHSPDVMIAASNADAVRRGDCMFVLGEVHMAANTIRFSFAASQHPRPEELFEAIQRDLPKPRVLPVPPKHWPRVTNRTSLALMSPYDYHLEVSSEPVAAGPRSQTLPITAFVVCASEEGLVVRSRNGQLEFDIIEFLGELLSGASIELMKIVIPRSHTPRITIDKLIVVRESWTFPVVDLDFIHRDTEHERYLEARRWMRTNDLPRFVFARVPVEVKPFYVDFESPVYVEILIKMIRRMLVKDRAGTVTITEMLPTPDSLWLSDAEGQRYTSELRMVTWDLLSP